MLLTRLPLTRICTAALLPPFLLQALQTACPGFRGAIAAATANLSPATAAATMLNLTAQYSGLLSAVAPGGSSLVVLLPTGIDSLLGECVHGRCAGGG